MALAAMDRRPNRCLRQDARDIAQPKRRYAIAQRHVDAIARIHQDRALRDAVLKGLRDLRQRDLGLGLKRISSGTPAFTRLAGSAAHSFGR